MSNQPFDLPPLPEPEAWNTHNGAWGDKSTDYAYTMRQMQAYARAAVEAEREACAKLLDANAQSCNPDGIVALVLETNAAAIRARGKS